MAKKMKKAVKKAVSKSVKGKMFNPKAFAAAKSKVFGLKGMK